MYISAGQDPAYSHTVCGTGVIVEDQHSVTVSILAIRHWISDFRPFSLYTKFTYLLTALGFDITCSSTFADVQLWSVVFHVVATLWHCQGPIISYRLVIQCSASDEDKLVFFNTPKWQHITHTYIHVIHTYTVSTKTKPKVFYTASPRWGH